MKSFPKLILFLFLVVWSVAIIKRIENEPAIPLSQVREQLTINGIRLQEPVSSVQATWGTPLRKTPHPIGEEGYEYQYYKNGYVLFQRDAAVTIYAQRAQVSLGNRTLITAETPIEKIRILLGEPVPQEYAGMGMCYRTSAREQLYIDASGVLLGSY